MTSFPPPTESEIIASRLLDEWAQTRPAGASLVSTAVRAAFVQFATKMLTDDQDDHIDWTTMQYVLRQATGLGMGRGAASGPTRCEFALAKVRYGLKAVDLDAVGQGIILLVIQCREAVKLVEDELDAIMQTLQKSVGSAWEIIVRHFVVPDLAQEIQLGLLLAPAAQAAEFARARVPLVALPPVEPARVNTREELETKLICIRCLKEAALAEQAYEETSRYRDQEKRIMQLLVV